MREHSRITVTIRIEQRQNLRELSTVTGLSESALMRRALDRLLGEAEILLQSEGAPAEIR